MIKNKMSDETLQQTLLIGAKIEEVAFLALMIILVLAIAMIISFAPFSEAGVTTVVIAVIFTAVCAYKSSKAGDSYNIIVEELGGCNDSATTEQPN